MENVGSEPPVPRGRNEGAETDLLSLIKASQTTSYFILPKSSVGGQIRSAIVLSGYCSHFFPVWIYEIIVFWVFFFSLPQNAMS